MANNVISGLGFHHIALKANDYEKSVGFYKKLGLVTVAEWGAPGNRIMMLDLGDGGRIELFENGGDEYQAEGKYAHFAMCCDDVDKAYEYALSIGAEPHMAPKTVPLDSKPGKMSIHIAFVKGPSGEQLEFFKEV